MVLNISTCTTNAVSLESGHYNRCNLIQTTAMIMDFLQVNPDPLWQLLRNFYLYIPVPIPIFNED